VNQGSTFRLLNDIPPLPENEIAKPPSTPTTSPCCFTPHALFCPLFSPIFFIFYPLISVFLYPSSFYFSLAAQSF
jgi:hypothetical protein